MDNAGVMAIMKALKTHCPPFKDYDGKFLRSCVQKDFQIYIFTFKTTATFTECHTNKKYHALVPGPPSPTIGIPPFLRLPFHPQELLPTFAADQCSFEAFTQSDDRVQLDITDLSLNSLNENFRKEFLATFLRQHYPHISTENEYVIESNYTRFRGRIDLLMIVNEQAVSVHLLREEEGEEEGK